MIQLPYSSNGFTLQELMLSIAIFALLAGLGVPGYIGYIRNGELSNSTTSLFSDLHYARSEAIKRKTTVAICRSADPTVTTPTCGGSSNTWSDGWIVYVEVGGASGNFSESDGDILLKVGAPPSDNVAIISNTNADSYVEYLADGSLNVINAPSVYSVCVDRDNDGDYEESSGREIRVNPIGRPKVTVGGIGSCESPS